MANGGMTDPQEFWNALGRLYGSTVELRIATTALAETAKAHENRLDKEEITVVGFYENPREIKAELTKIRQRLDQLERPKQ